MHSLCPTAALALALAAPCVLTPSLPAQDFQVVPSPNVGAVANGLAGVDGRAPDDVWAVGTFVDPSLSVQRTLAMHWDGTDWSVDPTPNPAAGANRLSDVATPPGATVWAVGLQAAGSLSQPLLLRREAGTWSEASIGFSGPGFLSAVHDIAADDVWAVGGTLRPDGFPQDTLALHFDGSTWTRTPLPPVSNLRLLAAVDASGPDDVWAVGSARATIFGSASPLVYRWNGVSWNTVALPLTSTGLTAVAVNAPDDVWVTGIDSAGDGVMAHWDGAAWTTFDSQGPEHVRSVALAENGTPFAATGGEVYRYDPVAGRWTEVVSTFTGNFFDIATGPAGNIWAGSGGVYGSVDSGQTWSWSPIHTSPHSGTPASVFTVAVGPDQTVYACGWRSSNSGQSWQSMPRALLATAFVGSTVWAGTFDGVYRSTSSGASWTASGLTGLEVGALASNGVRFVAATASGLWGSPDGATWTQVSALADVDALAATSNGAFWAAAQDGLYRSPDGLSWSLSPAAFAGQSVVDVTARGMDLLAVVDGVPHHSTDAGGTWTALVQGLSTTGGARFPESYALAVRASDDVYALGERVLHWNGTSWTETDELASVAGLRLEGAVRLPDGSVWGVGRSIAGGVERTFTARDRSGVIGSSYCQAQRNSSNLVGEIQAAGSNIIVDNDLVLTAINLPHNVNGYFVVAPVAGFVPNPAGSSGNLCIGQPAGRYVDQIGSSGTTGMIPVDVDLTAVPQPTGSVLVQPGETWHFQCWHRDAALGVATSNFTRGFAVTFQ